MTKTILEYLRSRVTAAVDKGLSRRGWFKALLDLARERWVFINEAGGSTKMARLRSRAQRGMRCRSPIPHGHWNTTTFTGALRSTGMTAPKVLDGPMTGMVRCLCPAGASANAASRRHRHPRRSSGS